MTTPFERDTTDQITLRDKIMIVVYPETLFRMFTGSKVLYNSNDIPFILSDVDNYDTSEWSISNDFNTEDDVRDMIIYRYFYEVIPN